MWLESLMLSSVEMLPYMSFGSHLLSLSDGGIWSIQFCPSSNKHPHPHYSSAMRSINIHFML